ncbi:hypothetical protein SAMN05421805_10348 [Saccharopolyspora antimicrobica]|uniref:Uncharacterized protein n=1 Tax=Saccharopolyspora antimicrobica TaxID=455193 RepID=A0A1I4WU60_9PSEU|nr:hypothetical protein [Saccharopolyspora antimicrobica]RKT82977.1 hypothetical protein ATL45_1242 [Saccharopolyspora antimicrobica]SFN16680.1 hypothetical protein SAMN05421805_10348 [Saccharopolyspora antimicrobica]
MSQQKMLDALTAEWDDVADRLDPETFTRLVSLIAELQDADADTSAMVTEDIASLLGDVLPVEHPVRRALAEPVSRFRRPEVDWDRLSTGLRDRLTGSAPSPRLDQLLAVESLDAQQLSALGTDPADPDLIRLPAEGGDRYPAFQFDADGTPRALVRTVNRHLRVTEDPWGAADWWLGPNDWLGGIPARLIGQVDDTALIDAARDESAEV